MCHLAKFPGDQTIAEIRNLMGFNVATICHCGLISILSFNSCTVQMGNMCTHAKFHGNWSNRCGDLIMI